MHVGDRTADHRLERQAGDRFGGVIERQDALRGIGRQQTARQAVDDVLVQRLQIGDLRRGALEPRAGRSHALGQRSAEQRDGEEPEQVQRDDVLRHRARWQLHRIDRQPRQMQRARRPSGTARRRGPRKSRRSTSRRAVRRAGIRTMLPATIGSTYSRREEARDAAGEVDERGHDDARRTSSCRSISQRCRSDEAQRDRVDDRQRVGQRNQKEERIDGKRTRRLDLQHGRAAEQQRADQRACRDQPSQFAFEVSGQWDSNRP